MAGTLLLAAIYNSPAWGAVGLLVGVLGGVIVAWLNRKPTELQLGDSAYDQLVQLSGMYKSDLIEYRQEREKDQAAKDQLRLALDGARVEIAALKHELQLARAEIQELRASKGNL